MLINQRQQRILELLSENPALNVKSLANLLHVSEPTIRRDFTELAERHLLTKFYGGAKLVHGAADSEIPFMLRENERSQTKVEMGKKAAEHIADGMVIMLDGSTSAYYIVPYLQRFKDLIVVTSGAKTAVALAERNIRTYSTGGQMMTHSFSLVGEEAESFIRKINANICFFSCRGLTLDGIMTDVSVAEVNLRRVMFSHSKKKVLLCDSSKFGKTYFYNQGRLDEVDELVSDKPFVLDR